MTVCLWGEPLQVSLYATGLLCCLSVCNVGVLWPNGWMDQDATWYGGRPRPRRHCVRWGPSPTQFRPMSIVTKRLDVRGCIKMPLGTDVDLGPGDVVLDGVPAPPKRGFGSRPWPRPHCVTLDQPPRKGHSSPPLFGPCPIVATVAHLSYC